MGTTRASVQRKPQPGPPTITPADFGRWVVTDYRGYVLYCGEERYARRFVHAWHATEARKRTNGPPRV